MSALKITENKAVRGRPFTADDPRANRAGRPKGSRGKRAAALLELLRPEGERLLARAVSLALDDKAPDPGTLRDLLGRLLPAPDKSAPVRFAMPEGATLVAQSAAVLAAIANGDLTPEEGQKIAAALASHADVVAAHELSERLAVLESRLAAGGVA
nr:hypothetical protein [uncultured Albidiferax sp.]